MKTKLICLILALTCLLTACSHNPQPGTQSTKSSGTVMPEDEDYGKDGTLYADVNGVLYQYSIQNGYATPLCGDPLCKHNDSSCPFYGIGEDFYRIGSAILYSKGNSILKYDTETGDITTLGTADGQIYYMTLIENRLYFNALNYDFAPDAEHTVRVGLFYMDLADNSITKLNTEPLYEMQDLYGLENGRLLWYDVGLWTYYTSDMEYRDIVPADGEEPYGIHAGGHSYRLEVSSAAPMSFNLYNTVDGEKNIVLRDIVSIKGYGDALFATYNHETGKYIGMRLSEEGKEVPVYDYQGREIYRYDSEGGSEVLLCTLPEDCIIDSLGQGVSAMSSGNYIGIPLREYVFDSRGYVTGYQTAKNIVIVNCVTGEYIVTRTS